MKPLPSPNLKIKPKAKFSPSSLKATQAPITADEKTVN